MRSRMSIEYASLGVSGLLPDNTEIANGGVRKERERERERETDVCDSPATCCRRCVLTLQQQADKQWSSF